MRSAASGLLRAAAVSLVAVAMGPAALALAEPPNVTIESPANGSISNNRTPSFSGSTDDPLDEVTLQIYPGTTVEEGAQVQTLAAPLPLSGTWSTDPAETLADGVYTAQASQTNPATEQGASEPVTFTVDTTSPTVALSPVASPTNDPTPTFKGSAGVAPGDIASVKLRIYQGTVASGSPIRTVSVTPSGVTWSAALLEALEDGTYTAQAEQSDSAGNTGESESSTFTIKTNGPAISLSPVASPTNDSTPSFSGGAGNSVGDIASVRLKVYSGAVASGSPVRTVDVTPSGATWNAALVEALKDGTYTAQAEQSDEAGNTGKSAPSTFRIDTTPPAVSLTQAVSPTNASTPTFKGSAGVAVGDNASVKLKIYAGTVASGSPLQTVSVAPSGASWSASAVETLSDGTYTAQAEQSDEAGNTGESASSTFTIKTSGPAVSLNPVASPTNDPTPGFTGGAGVAAGDIPSVSLKIYSGAVVSGSPVRNVSATPSGGSWTVGAVAALADGTYTAQAEQSDEAGNTAKSAPSTFRVDTTPPTVSLSSVGSLTNDSTPSFSGGAGVALGDIASVKLKIYSGTVASGTPVQTVNATLSGASWSVGAVATLADGTYTAQAEQSDEAGNTGKSGASTFSVDTHAPAIVITTPSNGKVLNVSRPTFSGTAGNASGDHPSVTLKIYVGESVSGTPEQTLQITPEGTKWTTGSTGPQLHNGTYTAQAEQSDDAGNIGTRTTTFTIKTNSPTVTLNTDGALRGSKLVTGATPSFSGSAGTAPEDSRSVTVKVYSGTSTSETPESPARTVVGAVSGSSWTTGPVAALPEGTYTAQAEQQDSNPFQQTGFSESSTFTVDATPPQVTLINPPNGSSTSNGSQLVTGSAGASTGDLRGVTVLLFSGSAIEGQAPLQSIQVTAMGGTWSCTFAGLGVGTYTVRAEQSDDVGNLGVSSPATFSVLGSSSSAILAPPAASFSWSPIAPHTGERVSLLSNSTDPASPITAFAWDLAGNGAFAAGGPVSSTSFSTPGKHLVQLRVTDANGLSSVAAETIDVGAAVLPLMQPFPTVRITATRSGGGIKLKLLSVRTSAGARITVKCTGRGCPIRSQSRLAAAGTVGATPIEFRRFERSLRAGVVLEIRVSRTGEIGKYTRLSVRRGRLPARTDACVGPTAGKPIPCPTS